jgi:hypothetical protein
MHWDLEQCVRRTGKKLRDYIQCFSRQYTACPEVPESKAIDAFLFGNKFLGKFLGKLMWESLYQNAIQFNIPLFGFSTNGWLLLSLQETIRALCDMMNL